MKEKSKMIRRLLAGLLSLVMMFTMVPVTAVETEAATTGEYISMPITIRDYAADGMLFEFNQTGATGTTGATETSTFSIYGFNPTYDTWFANYSNGIYVCTYDGITSKGPWGAGKGHLMIVCDGSGNIVKVVPAGTAKGTYSATKAEMKSGYYVIWCGSSAPEYSTLSAITASNKDNYTLTYSGNTLTMTVSGSGTVYNQGDTAGFSMLSTSDKDYINNLTDSSSIAGTTLLQNGSWGLKTDPDAVTTTLNSGATQEVYGAWIRTDLVQSKLVNGEMVYTEAAVKYIAEYMQQLMAVPKQNSDGSYNTYYVMGHELSELGGTDLATKIRAQVTGELGTYADAKAKFDAGNLNDYTQITTYYDAAYFLLHNVFNDNTGYGKTVSNYKNLNLVQTTNSDGETCYVFNSGYDDTKYDYTNGVIYNTQTDTITIAKTNSGTESYVRGNALPAARFDPLGKSGAGVDLGYGMSGDIYGDLISASTADWADYYDTTNYNMSLEGHAQFIYYEDDNLYFTFTGDDDVYLFINGIRVLDVGAAHSISKVKIKLNDVAKMCGLKDGQSYDFDFFYMERHGTAANFGIETNIKIVDPAMTTTKTGYQNGVNTGYNGYVDPLEPVVYEFGLENKGEAKIEELTFKDENINVSLSKEDITLNGETEISELSVTVYNADGSQKQSIAAGSLTEDQLKQLLADGLDVGEKIVIYGFEYTVPTWTDNAFTNTVYTTAVSYGDNNSKQNLNGMADWKVQKREYDFQDYHVYEWVGKGVTLTKDELLQPIVDAGVNGFEKDSATIELSSASGATSGNNVNDKAVLNDDGSITYTGTTTGADTFYYKVTEGEDAVTAVIGVAVYSYDVADNTYVLDYGLAVELNGDDFGLRVNDTLELSDNPNATTAKVTDISGATSNYGDFTWNDPSLKYTPDDIIDNIDTVKAYVQVLEDGATELTKFTGVAMNETVTTAPANVVYYEENFPGITYVSTDENQWVHYETVDEEGNSMAGTEQSADQDSNYGSDPNYSEDVSGEWNDGDIIESTTFQLDTSDLDSLQQSGIEKLNEYLGYMTGQDSNGTVNALVVNKTAEVMYFDFVGTGFEIISRTTDEQYAVINVIVYLTDGDGNIIVNEEGSDSANADLPYTNKNGVVTQKPVITESKGGDLYQVPIISITGLPKANYRVSVKAAGSTETKTRVLYIDGIRIYGPLSDEEALEYYNPEEYQAEFLEIKQLIGEGKAIYADASDTDDELQLVTGTTLIEDVDAAGVLTSISSVDEYMKVGPNNEIYLDSTVYGMIAFWVTPDEDTPESARTIEIGAHRKSDSSSELDGVVTMAYGSTAEDIIEGTYTYEIASGTEQYYTIDVNNLPKNNAGKYLVLIGINDSENIIEALALTNLKVSGYEISFAETAIQTAAEEGNVKDEPMVNEIVQVYNARNIIVEPEEEVVEVPVNENLSISSAALRATSIVSGKSAILTLKANAAAEDVVITDANGDSVELTKCTRKVSGDVATFTVMWTVTGSRGDSLNYTTRVYDADGLASVNAETVTVTIK